MRTPFYFFNMMAIRTQTNVTGITVSGDNTIDLIVDLLHLLMAKKTASDKLKAITALRQLEQLIKSINVIERLTFTTHRNTFHRRVIN